MATRTYRWILAFALIGLGLAAGPAVAGSPYPYPWGIGGLGYLPASTYTQDYVPYFALHPPVYYSYVVPRTYGYSPYAYPPGTMTPDATAPEPKLVRNKFVPEGFAEAALYQTERPPQPVRIINPYVVKAN